MQNVRSNKLNDYEIYLWSFCSLSALTFASEMRMFSFAITLEQLQVADTLIILEIIT